MRMEQWYMAIPSDSPLLERAKVDPAFGEDLGFPGIFSAGGAEREPYDDAITIEFCDAVKQMNATHPGLSSRVYTLDRWYEILHYLLAGADRFERRDPEDWTSIAIDGAHPLPEHLRGVQGPPIRHTPAPLVQEIATSLTSLDAPPFT